MIEQFIMKLNSLVLKISCWLQSTKIFVRPSKQISGKWELFEYYTDQENNLNNVNEEQLINDKQSWVIEFTEDEKYLHNSNLSVSVISSIENGTWSVSKNFVTLIHPENFRNNIEFQFAFEKGNLKLLKKDKLGKILIFGFFRRLDF